MTVGASLDVTQFKAERIQKQWVKTLGGHIKSHLQSAAPTLQLEASLHGAFY